MHTKAPSTVALLYPGNRAARDRADPAESRFAALFDAFAAAGVWRVEASGGGVETLTVRHALLRQRVGLTPEQLPLLWDCDFMFGQPTTDGEPMFVLCEVNVSSVSPFPPSSIAPLVEVVKMRLAEPRIR